MFGFKSKKERVEDILKLISSYLDETERPLDSQMMICNWLPFFNKEEKIRSKIYARALTAGIFISAFETACYKTNHSDSNRADFYDLFGPSVLQLTQNILAEDSSEIINKDKDAYENWALKVYDDVEQLTIEHLRIDEPRYQEWSDGIFSLYLNMLNSHSIKKGKDTADEVKDEDILLLAGSYAQNFADTHVEIYKSILEEYINLIQKKMI